MAKYYTKDFSEEQLENEIKAALNVAEPSKKSIDFILNYSKSLSVKKSEDIASFII